MTVFIDTAEMYRVGMEDIPPSQCRVCGHNTLYSDICGAMCHTCGADIESPRDKTILYVRLRSGLSIDDTASRTGFTADEVQRFECAQLAVPDTYWQAFTAVIDQHYRDNPKLTGESM